MDFHYMPIAKIEKLHSMGFIFPIHHGKCTYWIHETTDRESRLLNILRRSHETHSSNS